MYKYIFMQIRRSLLLNVLFCLLLVTAGVLLCLGTGLLVSARNGISALDGFFTTIALPDPDLIRKQASYIFETEVTGLYDTGQGLLSADDLLWGNTYNGRVTDYITDDILNSLKGSVYSSGIFDTAPRRVYGAYSPGIVPEHFLDNNQPVAGSAGHSAAFIGVCTEVLETQTIGSHIDPETGTPEYFLKTVAYISFAIEQELVYHPGLADGRSPGFGKNTGVVWTRVDFRDPGGGYFFTPGERYFLSGTDYRPQYSLWVFEDSDRFFEVADGVVGFLPVKLTLDDNKDAAVIGSRDTLGELGSRFLWRAFAYEHSKLTEGVFPMDVVSEVYNGAVDRRYAFKLDSGDDWQAAVDAANKGAYQLNIITTDNLYSFVKFNQNFAEIVSGRHFSIDETGGGARVCIIPNDLAARNELEVGDTIKLSIFEIGYPSVELYDTVQMWCDYYNEEDWDYKNDTATAVYGTRRKGFRAWMPGRYEYGAREAEPIEFEIVGLYSARPPLKGDPHNIPLNTVFIPEKSFEGFPGGQQSAFTQNVSFTHSLSGLSASHPYAVSYETASLQRSESPLLDMIILPNGGGGEFLRAISELTPEYSHLFRVYDQGYSYAKPIFDTLMNYSVLVFALCAAIWAASFILFCFFFVLRRKKEAGLLYALGVNRKRRFRWVMVQCAVLIIVAQAAAFAVSASLCQNVLDYAMETVTGMNSSADMERQKSEGADFRAGISGAERVEQSMILNTDPSAVPISAGVGAVLLLFSAGGISRRISGQGVKSFIERERGI